MAIDIRDFKGTAPSLAKQSLPDGMATVALNCRLGFTEMRPCSRMRPDHALASVQGSIYRHDGTWIEKPGPGWRFAPGPVSTDPPRLYETDPDGGALLWVDGAETKLGVMPPASAPSASASGGSGTAETRVYLYTCISEHGEEGAPSPASASVDVLPGGTVSLTGLATPTHAGYAAISKKRIYRSVVGASGAAAYLFVAEIDEATTTYSDTLAATALGEPLPSLGWALPPADLKGITPLTGGVLAGFSGREVRLSEPWYPHAWPDAYAQVVNHDIIQLGSFGRTLFVFTDGPVYFMTVNDPAATVPEVMAGDVPIASAIGVVNTPAGCVFPSKDGLYIVMPGSTVPQLLTRPFFSERDWRIMGPDTMFGAYHADQLFMAYTNAYGERGAMIFDAILTGDPTLRFTNAPIDAMTVVPDGRILFVETASAVQEWEGDASFGMDAVWASKEFVYDSPRSMAAALVDAEYITVTDAEALEAEILRQLDTLSDVLGGHIGGAFGMTPMGLKPFASDQFGLIAPLFNPLTFTANTVTFRVYADGLLRHTQITDDSDPFVLPGGFSAKRWIVQVESNVNVKRVAMGESVAEIYS